MKTYEYCAKCLRPFKGEIFRIDPWIHSDLMTKGSKAHLSPNLVTLNQVARAEVYETMPESLKRLLEALRADFGQPRELYFGD